MYKALYRKWRPTDFDGVCGQPQVTDILKYQVSSGKLSHAYLFCGSRGTGKTTCAKILAKAANCLSPVNGNPCNRCSACRSINEGSATDVLEMDAASNNGVENVRDLKDEIIYAPAELKYRVYIVDEVHMMSASAFNALLKTLEEPPAYVLFILATTELSKLPATIVSRCQRFDFRRLSSQVLTGRLQEIAQAEGIALDTSGAQAIARLSEGGMRDAISLLELCASSRQQITDSLVYETVGSGNRSDVLRALEAVCSGDCGVLLELLGQICMRSGDLGVFWQGLLDAHRDLLVLKSTPDGKRYLDLPDNEYETLSALAQRETVGGLLYRTRLLETTLDAVRRSGNEKRTAAEIAAVRLCDARLSTAPEALLSRIEALEREVASLRASGVTAEPPSAPEKQAPGTDAGAAKARKDAEKPRQKEQAPAAPQGTGTPIPGWRRVTEEFTAVAPAYATALRASSGIIDRDGTVLVRLDKPNFFTAKLLDDTALQNTVLGLVQKYGGASVGAVAIRFSVKSDGKGTGDEIIF